MHSDSNWLTQLISQVSSERIYGDAMVSSGEYGRLWVLAALLRISINIQIKYATLSAGNHFLHILQRWHSSGAFFATIKCERLLGIGHLHNIVTGQCTFSTCTAPRLHPMNKMIGLGVDCNFLQVACVGEGARQIPGSSALSFKISMLQYNETKCFSQKIGLI